MTRKILNVMQPFQNIRKDALIALKPNLVLAKPASLGATTSPEIAREIIAYLAELGFQKMMIIESSWLGDSTERAYQVCGYEDIAKEFAIPLFDLKKDRTVMVKQDGLTIEICRKALEADFLINIPVLKAHCQTRLTCALKNLKGCIPDREKKRFHSLGLHRPIALLNKIIKTHLIIVDALRGDLTYEEGGTPVELGRIIGGYDPVLTDSYAAGLIGYQIRDIPYITIAEKANIGRLYNLNTTIQEIDQEHKPSPSIAIPDTVKHLAQWIDAREACSPCYGGIIHALRRLQEQGKLDKLPNRVCVGRGYRNGKGRGIGVGSCAAREAESLSGCPPRASDIIDYLNKKIDRQH